MSARHPLSPMGSNIENLPRRGLAFRVSTDRQARAVWGSTRSARRYSTISTAALGSLCRSSSRSRAGSDWTELAKALAACRKHKAKLVIAKLDRLSRNHEREMISERSKAALAAARARGNVLGNPRLADAAQRGREAGAANARRFAANVLPIIEEIERSGVTSHNAIAAKLNERNVKTARGGRWTHVQVGAVLRPFGA
jgi:DNA invertase Pin-like site-specific DNA recombinase